MKLGIFAKTFSRPTLEEILDVVVEHGLTEVQFNLACAGLPTLPERIDDALIAQIRRGFAVRGLRMAALSGTFNLIHPDPSARRQGLARLSILARAAPDLGTKIITLCTGTRDADNMWRGHPENQSTAAWEDLLASMEQALEIAGQFGILLGIEPEVANVVDSAFRARRLLDYFSSPGLKIVMDPANLFQRGELSRMHAVMSEAFQLLAGEIVIAHAKDLIVDGDGGHEAAGTGLLDYDFYISQLARAGFEGPLILHSLAESQVAGCIHFLTSRLANNTAEP